ncbi:hypothetical protein [Planctomicrobium sp. SH527]|uniref:hypothetical protein n=1 Tax=Planctomicrobium sp. SH527 TaxID=3448123 RepID=UPI003F5B97F3
MMILRLATVILALTTFAQVRAADKVMLQPQLAREAAAWNAFKLSGTEAQKQARWETAVEDFQKQFGKVSVKIDGFVSEVKFLPQYNMAHIKYRSPAAKAFSKLVLTPQAAILSLQCTSDEALSLRVGDRVQILADLVYVKESDIKYPHALVAFYRVNATRSSGPNLYRLEGRLFASTYTAEIGKLKLNYKATPTGD